ncbi:MAG: hypothetical protein ABIR54_18885 [Burkholderiaceae bacterium]|jgi:hypothetical protein
MNIAAAYVAQTNHAANDWARSQTARKVVRAAMNSNAVVYRRTWPTLEAIEMLGEAEYDPALRFNGFMDSTLDLRDGLSVVEVFAPIEEPAALQEFALLRR